MISEPRSTIASDVGVLGDATSDVVIIGAGVIGLSIAWRLAQRGAQVTVADPQPLHAASRAAAGMLAPVSEVTHGEEPLLRLARESLRRYPSYVEELEAITGRQIGLRRDGTLVVAADAGDREVLRELCEFQSSLGLEARMLTSRDVRRIEPGLSPRIRAGIDVAGDHSVDNRRLGAALLDAVQSMGVRVLTAAASELLTDGGRRATGVRLDDGSVLQAATTVLAAGPWCALLAGVPDEDRPPVRPVKGQILRLHAPAELLPTRTIRGFVNGRESYLIPRTDGELVVGATVEDRGFDRTVTAVAVRELLDDARTVYPGVDEMALVESMAAGRPGSPDNTPIVGQTTLPGLVVATGHYRNGILLAPVTADIVADLVAGAVAGAVADPELAALVDPRRFHSAVVA